MQAGVVQASAVQAGDCGTCECGAGWMPLWCRADAVHAGVVQADAMHGTLS